MVSVLEGCYVIIRWYLIKCETCFAINRTIASTIAPLTAFNF
ncbi:MAG: hypothetical protein ACTS68_00140 [Candidatus Hodgkinia cicadicola]